MCSLFMVFFSLVSPLDFSNFQLNLPETSLEAEVLRHSMYAQVMKDPPTSSSHAEPAKTSTERASKESVTPPEQAQTQTPAPDDQRSKFSTFLAPNESSSSPKRGDGDSSTPVMELKGDAPNTEPEVGPQVAPQIRASPKVVKAPRIATSPPSPPTRDTSPQGPQVSNETSSAVPASNRSAPKPATRTSSLKPDNLESPKESPVTAEPPEVPAAKPRPRPKPRDSVGPSAELAVESQAPREPEELPAEPSADVAAKSQTAPRDFGRSEKGDAVPVNDKHFSLPAGVSSQDMARYAELGEDHHDTKGTKRRSGGVEGATAAGDSDDDDSEDEEYEEDYDEEEDDEGDGDHDDVDSPPLPERKYRGK